MRKSIEVTITEDGNPIVFRIQQMSATEQERWIIGVGLAIAGCAGAYTDIGDDISGGAIMGMIEKDSQIADIISRYVRDVRFNKI